MGSVGELGILGWNVERSGPDRSGTVTLMTMFSPKTFGGDGGGDGGVPRLWVIWASAWERCFPVAKNATHPWCAFAGRFALLCI